ncbi:ATV_HP_G0139020.mRNA.1.CDS.1 [Saccharomyces cerevisiae]|nr:ATV_HP_G0139020.mRNA.1.CDS.1 [Saccharomyces cerevisiae]CAI6896691.1 ATV_HP_G0139020.mRNA.1.CDS.1 [Saccharomyces cerevisiae]
MYSTRAIHHLAHPLSRYCGVKSIICEKSQYKGTSTSIYWKYEIVLKDIGYILLGQLGAGSREDHRFPVEMAPDEADTLNVVKKSYLEKTGKDLSARRFVDDDPVIWFNT